jgi:hypothetical protein
MVTATVKGKKLIIEADIAENPRPSAASGKTLIVASTGGGQKTDLTVAGGALTISLNAYIPNTAFVKQKLVPA